jgi:protein gp37
VPVDVVAGGTLDLCEETSVGLSKIEWTDYTFNHVIGCTKVSEGCRFCYAEADMDKRRGRVKWGPQGTRSKTSADYWRQPIRWNRDAVVAQNRRRVFCASLADVFEEWSGAIVDHDGDPLMRDKLRETIVPEGRIFPQSLDLYRPLTMDDMRRDLFRLIDATPRLDWLLLTKRPENIRKMWAPGPAGRCASFPDCTHPDCSPRRENVWLLTSVEDQEQADKRIPELLKCRSLAPVLGLSVEPLLSEVDLRRWLPPEKANWHCQKCGAFQRDFGRCLWCGCHGNYLTGSHAANHQSNTFSGSINRQPLDWVICGGESGPHARQFDVAWADAIIRQCKAAGVACFMKQYGSKSFDSREADRGSDDQHQGGAASDPSCRLDLKDSKGGDMEEWAEAMRVREFPRVEADA